MKLTHGTNVPDGIVLTRLLCTRWCIYPHFAAQISALSLICAVRRRGSKCQRVARAPS